MLSSGNPRGIYWENPGNQFFAVVARKKNYIFEVMINLIIDTFIWFSFPYLRCINIYIDMTTKYI